MLQGILQLSNNDSGLSVWLGLTLLIFSISLLLYTIVTFKPESKNIPRIGLGKQEIMLHWAFSVNQRLFQSENLSPTKT